MTRDSRRLMGGDYAHNVDNPLHEAIILYFHDRKDEAKRQLLRLAGQEKYAAQAQINYGILCEREGDYSAAESAYRTALRKGEKTALFYLISLNARLRKELPGGVISLAGDMSTTDTKYWVEYRRAEECLRNNDREGAMDHLKKSVDDGLPPVALVYWDPAFKAIRDDGRFKEIMAKARSNNARYTPMTKSLEQEQFNHFRNSPLGMSRELMKVCAMEPAEDAKAEEALLPLLSTGLNPRDRALALYWLARIKARKKDFAAAGGYLAQFKNHIRSATGDTTGFISVIRRIEPDLYANDPLLKSIR